MEKYILKDALVAEIKKLHGNPFYRMAIKDVLSILDTMQEEPVSEDLEEAADNALSNVLNTHEIVNVRSCLEMFKSGAKWQKAKDESITEDLGEYINELSKQFPETSFAKLSRIAVRVSRWQRTQDTKNKLPNVLNRTDLDEFAYQCAYDMSNDWAIDNPTWNDVENACKLGAKWQKAKDQSTIELAEDHAMLAGMEKMKEQMMKNIWKPADGNDLPIIDREVIALLDNGKVVFAHRPPEYWDGKNIITGKVTRNYPKTYDKGGWNIPNIKYWLDVELPKEIEL